MAEPEIIPVHAVLGLEMADDGLDGGPAAQLALDPGRHRMFRPLRDVATVSLGYKSLQNNFFYVNKATIDTYGIEKKYLIPIFMLRDLNSDVFEQNPKPTVWLFACKEKIGDLNGTGARRYIEAMADRSASDKKQTGKNQTIREALEEQSGGVWFYPKARPNKHHIWLRKAIGSVYAPFFFEDAALVDQRLNSIAPVEGVKWKELAAVLTSSLFAYSLEVNGAAAMGAGALEAPTTKLRDYPIFDIRDLEAAQRTTLISLAEAVWEKEKPVDWGKEKSAPGKELRALDEWLLQTAGRNVSVTQMYNDLRSACLARALVAEDKTKKTKKQKSDSIGNVAESIVKAINPIIQSRSFPNDFANGVQLDLPMSFDRSSLKEVSIHQLLDSCEIEVRTRADKIAYHGTHPRPVAEAIIRALMWGRSQFSVSSDRKAMDAAVNKFLAWASKTEENIEKAIRESAYGTGYEDVLKKEVYTRIGIHPLSGAKTLPPYIAL